MSDTFLKKENVAQPARIAVLCCDAPLHFYLISQLQQHFQLCGVVIESDQNQMDWLWKKRRYKLWLARKYHGIRRRWMGGRAFMKKFFRTDFDMQSLSVPVKQAFNINDQETVGFLNDIQPDITIVCGTMFIGKRVRTAGNSLINLHGGVLPDYKGNQCIFFAFYQGNYDKIGATIHLVTGELDGGGIIDVIKPAIHPDDNDESLYAKALKGCIAELIDVLQRYDAGESIAIQTQPAGNEKVWSHRDRTIMVEIRHHLNRRRIARERRVDMDVSIN